MLTVKDTAEYEEQSDERVHGAVMLMMMKWGRKIIRGTEGHSLTGLNLTFSSTQDALEQLSVDRTPPDLKVDLDG